VVRRCAGRIPVVFVHGTASNPAYWADMFNTLLADPDLRANMQFWFFQYASGNPIMYSAMTLRDQLKAACRRRPHGHRRGPAQMILVATARAGSWCG